MAVNFWIQDVEFYRSTLLQRVYDFQQRYPDTVVKHWRSWFVHSVEVPESASMWFALEFSEHCDPEPPGIDLNADDTMIVNITPPVAHIWT